MADTTFNMIIPALKAVDLGDGTYAMGVSIQPETAAPTNLTFATVLPALKAVDLGDGTYAISVTG